MTARLRSQEGFGLVELLIAMTVINIAIFALYSSFTAGQLAIRRASQVGTATTLAEQQMELYRKHLYANVGLDNAQLASVDTVHTGDADAWDPVNPQYVAATCTPSLPECQPIRTVAGPDGRSYRVDSYVVVVPAGSAGAVAQARDMKRVTVVVRRSDNVSGRALARLTSTFDQATGCLGPATPHKC